MFSIETEENKVTRPTQKRNTLFMMFYALEINTIKPSLLRMAITFSLLKLGTD